MFELRDGSIYVPEEVKAHEDLRLKIATSLDEILIQPNQSEHRFLGIESGVPNLIHLMKVAGFFNSALNVGIEFRTFGQEKIKEFTLPTMGFNIKPKNPTDQITLLRVIPNSQIREAALPFARFAVNINEEWANPTDNPQTTAQMRTNAILALNRPDLASYHLKVLEEITDIFTFNELTT